MFGPTLVPLLDTHTIANGGTYYQIFNMLSPDAKVVAIGGSYGGMLAAWHRLKYPFLSIGAIASGAPIDFYPAENSSDAHGSEEVQRLFFEAVINGEDDEVETDAQHEDESRGFALGGGVALTKKLKIGPEGSECILNSFANNGSEE